MLLVTGSTGFVGATICGKARARGIAVRGTSRRSADTVVTDLAADTDWTRALTGCSAVIHAAARVHVMDDPSANPLASFRKSNTAGTLNLADQAAAANVQRFIFVSSVKVNGESTAANHSFTAADAPSPQDPYGISKMEAEQGLHKIAAETGMEIVIVRPPLVYGPGVKANFASLMRAVQRGIPLPLASVINNRRSFVALDNLVDLLITCLDHPAAANQTFLVSDGEDLSTADLLRRLGRVMDKPARLVPVPPSLLQLGANLLGKGDMAQRLLGNLQVDIDHTRNTLNWSPPISVDEGLWRAVAGLMP